LEIQGVHFVVFLMVAAFMDVLMQRKPASSKNFSPAAQDMLF